MVKNKYRNIEEFLKDLEYFRDNANDLKFMVSMTQKVTRSNSDIKKVLKSYLENKVADFNDKTVIREMVDLNTHLTLRVKSKGNPWFLV